mgnify:CR=1 FL=1
MAAHKHADLIKQMVDDDTLRATCGKTEIVTFCLVHVVNHDQYDWRLVPPKPKTITIVANGKTYELPEPMRVAPMVGDNCFMGLLDGFVDETTWVNDAYDIRRLEQSHYHATREAAQQWVDAMAEIRGGK